MGSLDVYEEFWRKSTVEKRQFTMNGRGGRLGDYQPLIQNQMLAELKQIAEERNVDGWTDHVSPRESFEENKSSVLNAGIPLKDRSSGPSRTRREREREHDERFERYQREQDQVRLEHSESEIYRRDPKGYWGDSQNETAFVVLEQDGDW